jgi:hypothetical protein
LRCQTDNDFIYVSELATFTTTDDSHLRHT